MWSYRISADMDLPLTERRKAGANNPFVGKLFKTETEAKLARAKMANRKLYKVYAVMRSSIAI